MKKIIDTHKISFSKPDFYKSEDFLSFSSRRIRRILYILIYIVKNYYTY